MKETDINNLYQYDKDYSYLEKVVKKALKRLKIKDVVFSIIFIDDEEMKRMNKEYRGIDKTTDVLSFAFEDSPSFKGDIRVLGDIYISIPKMIKQASDYGHDEKRELSFLTIHGLLHLLGYDHMTKEDEEVMFTLQEVLLNDKETR